MHLLGHLLEALLLRLLLPSVLDVGDPVLPFFFLLGFHLPLFRFGGRCGRLGGEAFAVRGEGACWAEGRAGRVPLFT